MKKLFLIMSILCLLLAVSVSAATLHGTIYDLDLKTVKDVLVEIDTTPQQQYLAKNGTYSFTLSAGNYTLTAKKGNLSTTEDLQISDTGDFVYDLFLFPGFEDEDQLWSEVGGLSLEEEKTGFAKYPLWSYLIALGIILILIGRAILAKRRYQKQALQKKEEDTEEKPAEHALKEELEDDFSTEESEDPQYLDDALEIIKKHEGRITQKQLRKEMMHLSEGKISLILTELEHKGQIKKIKKGRGNVLVLKNN